jgi:hypothetical protein
MLYITVNTVKTVKQPPLNNSHLYTPSILMPNFPKLKPLYWTRLLITTTF